MSQLRSALSLLVLFLFVTACVAQPLPADPEPGFVITGQVVRVELEGGFFALLADDGRRFDAGELPAAFQHDGLAVRARLEKRPKAVGVHMWGQQVKLLSIERR